MLLYFLIYEYKGYTQDYPNIVMNLILYSAFFIPVIRKNFYNFID